MRQILVNVKKFILLLYLDCHGFITATSLLLMTLITLLGATSLMMAATDLLIGGNYKTSEQAFYAAEAGLEEARGRLRATAGTHYIDDTHPTEPLWRVYIGSQSDVQALGFDSGDNLQSRVDSLQLLISNPKERLDYAVQIRHQTGSGDDADKVLYWGDSSGTGLYTKNTIGGQNIYLISSSARSGAARKTIEMEVARVPPITVPSPLYVKAKTDIHGSSTSIIGIDQCGGYDKPAISTVNNLDSVVLKGDPKVIGKDPNTQEHKNPSIQENATNLDINAMIGTLKGRANFSYNVTSATETGMNWGTPSISSQEYPSTCSVHNIVHYNTNGTSIKLVGQSSGCGILLVEGGLIVNGGFAWHGIILVSGTVTYQGGGDKQVTGSVMSGASMAAQIDNDVGGNASIVYCSSAIKNQTENLPLQVLSWKAL